MKITQLYANLELFSEGEPIHHSLFVRSPGDGNGDVERLLVIDPPTDITERFTLAPQSAALYTGGNARVALPEYVVETTDVAHIRIGEHLLDVYSRPSEKRVVYFPALGVLCGGDYGSDMTLPLLGKGSNGETELETLRMLARLSKSRKLRLFLPRIGSVSDDPIRLMERLAADVAYIHGLRRRVRSAATEGIDRLRALEESRVILPENRRTPLAWQVHRANVDTLYSF